MIQGVVEDHGGSDVKIISEGGVLSIPRNEIERVQPAGTIQNLVTQAKAKEGIGSFKDAIQLYSQASVKAASTKEKQEILAHTRRVLEKLIQEIKTHAVLDSGLNDVALIEEVKRYISDASLLSLLQAARIQLDKEIVQQNYDAGKREENRENFQKAIQHYEIIYKNYPNHPLAQNLDRILTGLYFKLGVKESKEGRDYTPIAYDAFKKVIQIDPKNAQALFYLGYMLYRDKQYKEAQDYLSQVDASALSVIDRNRLNSTLSNLNTLLTVVPTATPRPVITPTPEPTPEPSGSEKFTGWVKDRWNGTLAFINGLFNGKVEAESQSILNIIKLLLIILGAILVFWYIPMRILVWDLPNRRVIYADWRKIVNYTGLLGLIAYFIDRLIREEKKKRCPACNRAIDNPEIFDDYNFDICPYCEAKIKPPFTLPEIIQTRGQMMVVTRSLSSNIHDEAQRQQMLGFLQLVLIHARKIRASDVHLEREEETLLMRFRVDGVLTESIPVDSSIHAFMVSCIKVLCNLNIAEKRLPQDGHFRKVLLNEELNIRVSTIPTRLGEKVVMRLLDRKIANASLDSLGLNEEALIHYRTAITAPHGLILATGPTGSGKTTLQYSSLQFINDGTKNIVTVEDPIEYELEGINQVQHNTATGLTFATALRSILRQDPDVIMIGEIRDLETASIAVNAALTGHLVFSTVHTIDTSTALSRLIDIGVDVRLLSSAILCIVAQRLVRKLCPFCKKKSSASAKEMTKLGQEGITLEGKPIYRPKGCAECANTGYIGRTGIYEMLIPNQEIRALTEEGGSALRLRQAAQRNHMRTLREEGILKVLTGVTSIEEIIRVTTDDVFDKKKEE